MLIVIRPVSPGSWLRIPAEGGGWPGGEAGQKPGGHQEAAAGQPGPGPLRNSEVRELLPIPGRSGPRRWLPVAERCA